MDIVVFSEIRLLEKGELSEVGFGYIIFWLGCKSERKVGVGFVVRIFFVL